MLRIRVAELNIEIDNRYPFTERFCREFLADFTEPDLRVRVSDEELAAERESDPYHSEIGYLECICVYRSIALELHRFDAMVFHAAVIACDGRAVAFAAPSGTGKSTHIALWQRAFGDRVRIVNGDKPILRRIDGEWMAFGTPWRGKEGLGENFSAPLRALCFLSRGKENAVFSASEGEKAMGLFTQTLLPSNPVAAEAHLALLDDLATRLPAYRLECNMEEAAALVAHDAILKGTEK